MTTKVEVGFDLTVGDTPYFRLNDPMKGKLDNVTYRLSGPIFIDISADVTSVAVKRGKNRELDRYSAGQVNIVLNNETRKYDPLNASSPYNGNIIPRREVRISTDGYVVFTGVIEDWNLDYDITGKSNATIVGADAFTLLAQQTLTPGTATTQLTGQRINAVLSQPTVGWPLTQRDIDNGSSQVGADIFEGNVLSYLQKIEASEQGQFFMSSGGNVRFINGSTTPTSDLAAVTFADDGTGIPYVNASVSYGTELLFNQAEVTSPAGTAIANNVDSQTKYGITQTNVDTLLSSTTSTDALASYYVSRYGEPEYRFQELNVSLDGLSGEDKASILDIELGDIVIIKFTPNGIGDAIDRYGQIIGINHEIGVDRHNISFSIGSLQFAFLVLNDVGFGILDGNALGF